MGKEMIFVVVFAFLGSGCASREKTVALGVSLGVVVGGANGAALFPINTGKGMVKGAVIGGFAGGIVGWMIHKGLKKRDEKIRRKTLLDMNRHEVINPPDGTSGGNPALTKPFVEVDFVEPRIERGKFIEGHRVWKISEKSQWVFPQNIDRKGEEKDGE